MTDGKDLSPEDPDSPGSPYKAAKMLSMLLRFDDILGFVLTGIGSLIVLFTAIIAFRQSPPLKFYLVAAVMVLLCLITSVGKIIMGYRKAHFESKDPDDCDFII